MYRQIGKMAGAVPLDLGALTLGALLVAGCGSGPIASDSRQLYRNPDQPEAQQSPAEAMTEDEDQGQASRDQGMSDREIGRLLARLDTLEEDNKHLKKQLSDRYMEAIAKRQAELINPTQDPAADSGAGPADPGDSPAEDSSPADNDGSAAAPPEPKALSRSELIDTLLDRIEASDDPQHIKALTAAALSIAEPGHELDPDLLDPLDPRTREQVARFHQMVAVAYDELAANPSKPIDRAQMIANIDKVFGRQPLKIKTIQLCRRVDSYGVYQTFANKRFLSGQKNRMLVYVELENFHHEPMEGGDYEVKLEQQIELYDARGETTVWRTGPDVLTDECRNQRRDFFIVYPVELPARLSTGKYRLKVRIADKHSGSIAEKTLHEIEIVADQALVDGKR